MSSPSGRGGEGITTRAPKVIRALLPIRDAIRDVLCDQAADRTWAEAQPRLQVRADRAAEAAHGPSVLQRATRSIFRRRS